MYENTRENLYSEANRDITQYQIYFDDMSTEAQREVLDFKDLDSPDQNWYMQPLQHCVEPKIEMSQIDIDYAGKIAFGMYKLDNL